VTLLPRHWEWLAAQPGGASVALRKLVEAARRESEGPTAAAPREAAYRFASVMAGDRPGFEDMSRGPCSRATRRVSRRGSPTGRRMSRPNCGPSGRGVRRGITEV
jgi:hypothetical protein